MEQQEADDQGDHDINRGKTILINLRNYLGKNIKTDYAENDAGSKSHNVMETIFEPDCKKTSKEGRNKSQDRKNNRLHMLIF
jgi:hypothetical protein